MITEHPKNHLKPLFLLCENDVAQLVTINVAQLVAIKMAKRGPVSNITAYIYICKYLCMPHTSPGGHNLGFEMQRSRGRKKNKAE